MAIQMKKILISLILSFLIVGCEPAQINTSTAATESQATNALKLTKGLEDCKLFQFPLTKYDEISIVRCPNSTVTTNQKIQQGKTTYTQTTVTIDGVEYTPVVK